MEKIQEEHKELSKNLGNCFLSTLDVFDAIQSNDCFCIALDVTWSEAAVADPTKLVIKEIFPNYLSAESFIMAAQYTIGNNPEATGGFNKSSTWSLIVGANWESVTGCMPLFLFKEHYKIAWEKMK